MPPGSTWPPSRRRASRLCLPIWPRSPPSPTGRRSPPRSAARRGSMMVRTCRPKACGAYGSIRISTIRTVMPRILCRAASGCPGRTTISPPRPIGLPGARCTGPILPQSSRPAASTSRMFARDACWSWKPRSRGRMPPARILTTSSRPTMAGTAPISRPGHRAWIGPPSSPRRGWIPRRLSSCGSRGR